MEWHAAVSLVGEVIGILSLLGIGIEWFKPIKVYPMTALFEWAGDKMFKNVRAEIKEIRDDTKALKYDVDTNEIDRLREKIREFATDVKRGKRFTREQWEDIFQANDKYHALLDRNNKKNGFTKREMIYLEEEFKIKNCKDDFMKMKETAPY